MVKRREVIHVVECGLVYKMNEKPGSDDDDGV